jgi:hypothetical protein
MSAAVFTNDIYKRIYNQISNKALMKVARISTLIFGLITILVALLVPRLGGIVEVVLSVGAITGAPLFAPPIWSLFSNRQTAFSIITSSLLSLGINLFFKFGAPTLLGFSLSRANEMFIGVLGPILILGIFELYYRFIAKNSPIAYTPTVTSNEPDNVVDGQNQYALKVLGIAILLTGILIFLLGIMAGGSNWIILLVAGGIIILGSVLAFLKRGKAGG